ncbi:hypothetical protein [Bartonella sp. AA86SXKL]
MVFLSISLGVLNGTGLFKGFMGGLMAFSPVIVGYGDVIAGS